MLQSRMVSLIIASRWPWALVAVLASALSMGQPHVARTQEFHWDAPIATETQDGNVARRPSSSVKSSVRKKPTKKTNNQNAKSPKAKPKR